MQEIGHLGKGSTRQWWRRRWVQIVAAVAVVGVLTVVIAAEYVLHNVKPILRKRVIATLAERFNAPVELDHLDISLARGIEVRGSGLRIGNGAQPGLTGGQPQVSSAALISVDTFTFRTTFRGLLRQPTHVAEVDVDGMTIDIPPGDRRAGLLVSRQHGDGNNPKTQPKISLVVALIHAINVKLIIETDRPDKDPRVFDIQDVALRDVGANQPFAYDAQLINPIPRGQIHATGHFGPWVSDEPRNSAVDGDYTFDHADMSTIKGIAGTLSSTGHFEGVLQAITIDGTTDVPNFSLDVSHHAVALHTQFHALVDGTNGDVDLEPVQAHLLHSDFTCRGTVVNIHGQGHDIALDVDMPRARIEDMLQLGIKTDPPLMTGSLTMKAKLHIPPGKVRVLEKLELAGSFGITGVRFNNQKWQDEIDGLSLRAQGRPEDAEHAPKSLVPNVQSQMNAQFDLNRGLITVSNLHYNIPGAQVQMNGAYSTSGELFEFKGHVKTDAMASQMVTGWKSLLLMPFDKMLKKDGAGMDLPLAVSGTQGDVHFGLAMHGSADETPQQIAAEMKAKGAKPKPKD